MKKKQSIRITFFAVLACAACGGSARNSGKSADGPAAGGGQGGGAGVGQAGRGGTAGTGGVHNPCPQSSWSVETCFTPEQAWAQSAGSGGIGNAGGAAGASPEAGAAGEPDPAEAGAGGAARDECPPLLPSYQYLFGTFGPVVKDGKCCYGYTQICG